MARQDNRELRAAQSLLTEAEARLRMAGRWSNPDLSVSAVNDALFSDAGERAFSIGLEQSFPLTGRLSLARNVGRLDVARSLREIRNAERILIEQVQKKYITAASARERAIIRGGAVQDAAQALAVAEQRAAAGQSPTSEIALARADHRRAQREYLAAESEADAHLLALASLLGRDTHSGIFPSESLLEIVDQFEALAADSPGVLRRPDAELLALDAERAGLEVALARVESWADIRLGVSYTDQRSIDEPRGLGDDQYLGVTLTVPLPLWTRSGPAVAERTARHAATETRLEAGEFALSNELASRLQRLSRLRNQAALYADSELKEMAESEQALARGFAEGRVDVRDLALIREYLVEFKLARVQTLAAVAIALVEWQAATGAHPAVRRPYANDNIKPDEENLP